MPHVSEQNCCCHHNLQGQKPKNFYHPIHISSGEGIAGSQPVRKIVRDGEHSTRGVFYDKTDPLPKLPWRIKKWQAAWYAPSTYLGFQAKQQVKISRQPTLPGAEAETTSRQEDQCTGMKGTSQALTVNDFYFLKNEITVNILTGLQVALQYSWR